MLCVLSFYPSRCNMEMIMVCWLTMKKEMCRDQYPTWSWSTGTIATAVQQSDM